jgi:hypothetical protein
LEGSLSKAVDQVAMVNVFAFHTPAIIASDNKVQKFYQAVLGL